ncbi:ORC-CDC6 family AAA ATPase [Sorangium sp. So ce542]|uniref:ORC-CDC6 family AAA ATPase n=1 Tax=Sorangium sp. So ce542 TaxID=3133316 RepID=UPI003F5EB125
MLQDPKIVAAVSKIIQRSERQEDLDRILSTYVDVGLLPQLDNYNHQVLYGRRGTGKTHVMKVLASRLQAQPGTTVLYIDCRTLGSTEQFLDATVPLSARCLALFRDILLAIYNVLLESIVERAPAQWEPAIKELDGMASLVSEPVTFLRPERVTAENSLATSNDVTIGAKIAVLPKPSIATEASSKDSVSESTKRSTQYAAHTSEKIVFPELQRSLAKILKLGETRLSLLIDEWSSLPVEVQPYLAELLKRGVLPLNAVTVKIAALEHRCKFAEKDGERLVGFELGADISTAPDLDDYFVYDRNPQHITDIYADVILRHLEPELPENYLQIKYNIAGGAQLASRLFTERATCSELARAAEGVIRDLINIFTRAVFHSQRRGRDSIDKKAILDSARQWFEQDKAQSLDEDLQQALRSIVDEVIGRRRARSFLLPRELEKHPVLQRLFDARVLHHMQRGYADKDRPGVRYNIYTIDYGAYVDLIGTSKEPQLNLIESEEDDADVVVPFDDKRSIRRIVLDKKVLESR